MREVDVKMGLEEAIGWERRQYGEKIDESSYSQATTGALMKASVSAANAAMKELIKANMESGADANEVSGELRVAFYKALKRYYKA